MAKLYCTTRLPHGSADVLHDAFLPPNVMAAQAAIHAGIDGTPHMRDWRAKVPAVYILASKRNGILYIGVTSDLADRMAIHKQKLFDGFTKKYGVDRLVYYEMHETMDAAILRETRLKKWKRAWKVRLIEQMNPEWLDLFDERTGEILDGPADQARSAE